MKNKFFMLKKLKKECFKKYHFIGKNNEKKYN